MSVIPGSSLPVPLWISPCTHPVGSCPLFGFTCRLPVCWPHPLFYLWLDRLPNSARSCPVPQWTGPLGHPSGSSVATCPTLPHHRCPNPCHPSPISSHTEASPSTQAPQAAETSSQDHLFLTLRVPPVSPPDTSPVSLPPHPWVTKAIPYLVLLPLSPPPSPQQPCDLCRTQMRPVTRRVLCLRDLAAASLLYLPPRPCWPDPRAGTRPCAPSVLLGHKSRNKSQLPFVGLGVLPGPGTATRKPDSTSGWADVGETGLGLPPQAGLRTTQQRWSLDLMTKRGHSCSLSSQRHSKISSKFLTGEEESEDFPVQSVFSKHSLIL